MQVLESQVISLDGQQPALRNNTLTRINTLLASGYYTSFVQLRWPAICAIVDDKMRNACVILPNGELIHTGIRLYGDGYFSLN